MPFDEHQAKIITEHLKDANLTCPVCANQSWLFVDVMAIPIQNPNVFTDPKRGGDILLSALRKRSGEGRVNLTSPTVFSGTVADSKEAFLVAVISCATCFYVMQFAWMPIVERARRGG